MIGWLMLACASSGPAPEALPPPDSPPAAEEPAAPVQEETEPAAATPTPSEAQQAMHRALSVRDPVPPCADVAALADDPASDWVFLAENAEQPPWVGLRAAVCFVTDHGAEGSETLERWVTEPQLKGLGWAVLETLEPLTEAQALQLATLALEKGPDPDKARARLADCPHEAVKALVAP